MNAKLLDDRRVLIGGAAALAVLILGAAWLLLIGPQLRAADDFAVQRDDTETQNVVLQQKLSDLAEQNERIGQLEDDLEAAQIGLPSTTALPAFTRQVTTTAATTGVDLGNVTISAPQAATVAPATAAGGTTPAGPQAMTVSLTSTGTYAQQTAFLKAIESGPRRALIGTTQVSVSEESRIASVDSTTSMSTQMTIFTTSAAPVAAAPTS